MLHCYENVNSIHHLETICSSSNALTVRVQKQLIPKKCPFFFFTDEGYTIPF